MSFYLAKEAPENFLNDVSYMMTNSPPSEVQDSALRNLKEMLEEITDKAKNMTNFSTFIDTHAKENQTLQFWYQFCLKIV